MKKFCVAFIILIMFSSSLKSQLISSFTDFSKPILISADLDTAKLLSDKPLKSPIGAVLRSAVLPGWGQVYNEKYLKGLFVFAVNGTFAYAVYYYNEEWEDKGKTKFRDKRNLYTWYLGATYLLTLIDAYIDAYLFGFEKAIELAVFENRNDRNIVGVRVALKL